MQCAAHIDMCVLYKLNAIGHLALDVINSFLLVERNWILILSKLDYQAKANTKGLVQYNSRLRLYGVSTLFLCFCYFTHHQPYQTREVFLIVLALMYTFYSSIDYISVF